MKAAITHNLELGLSQRFTVSVGPSGETKVESAIGEHITTGVIELTVNLKGIA